MVLLNLDYGLLLSAPNILLLPIIGLVGLLIPIIIFCLLFIVWFRWRRSSMNRFPGPKTHWIFGNLHQLHVGPLVLQDAVNWMREYGDVFRIWSVSFPVLVLCGPEPIRDFMKKDTPKGLVYTLFHEWLGEGLLTSNGESWKRKRRLFTPAFHFSILKDYTRIYSSAAEKIAQEWERVADTGKEVDVSPQITALTLDIIGVCAFNTHLKAQDTLYSSAPRPNTPEASYVSAIAQASDLIFKRVFSPGNATPVTRALYWITTQGREMMAATRVIHALSEGVIASRKKFKQQQPTAVTSPSKYQSFLDILLAAGDPDTSQPLSSLEIRNEVDTFMFEGHDTTAASLTWTIYLLSKHPEIQEKVRAEINRVLGDKDSPDAEDLVHLKYLEMVIKESLRLYPPVPFITRQTTEPLTVNGNVVPAGTEVFICPYVIHRNPRYWDEPVEKFDPERFSYENVQKRDPFAYIPFSAGNRNCIGQNFAMMEEKTLLAKLFHRFKVRAVENQNVIAEPNLILRPQEGIKVTIHKVSSEETSD